MSLRYPVSQLFYISAPILTCPVSRPPCLSAGLSINCHVSQLPCLSASLSLNCPVFQLPCLSAALSLSLPASQLRCLLIALHLKWAWIPTALFPSCSVSQLHYLLTVLSYSDLPIKAFYLISQRLSLSNPAHVRWYPGWSASHLLTSQEIKIHHISVDRISSQIPCWSVCGWRGGGKVTIGLCPSLAREFSARPGSC
jgi:hypothetical protein